MSLINASTDTLPILLRDPTKSRQFFHVPRPHTPILWYTILKRKQAMQQITYTYWTTPDGW
ncbi:MAG: hypothetical protein J6V72_16825, partial [Kiritimatiellae bacterium]|nr:hypothetical protein [Kiritimatiellia bacterium]